MATNQIVLGSLLLLGLLSVAASAATRYPPVKEPVKDESADYILLSRLYRNGPERAQCIGKNRVCRFRLLECPKRCPDRISYVKKKQSCFIDCSPKCEATCKNRRPNCLGYGSVCYDPRFVGGDGVMFYFHGMSEKDFAIFSDTNLQINAHFIGKRVQNRTRDFTWVQSLGMLFGKNSFTVGSKKVGVWDDSVDQLVFSYNRQPLEVSSVWYSDSGDVKVERIAATNGVEVVIDKLLTAIINVVPIGEKENRIHNYQLTSDDCFAHLDVQFKFHNLSATVDGVLGQTYRPDFQSPVKVGVPMPIMGGEDRFQVRSIFSADCKSCRFEGAETGKETAAETAIQMITQCSSSSGSGGMMCRR